MSETEAPTAAQVALDAGCEEDRESTEGPIGAFRGRWAALSNFAACDLIVEGQTYASVEHAYQAAKTPVPAERDRIIAALTPGRAKRLGSQCTQRADWVQVKVDVMRRLLLVKFSLPGFRDVLLSTGTRRLVEGNTWHDNVWGVCSCSRCTTVNGANLLGELLMELRAALRGHTGLRRSAACPRPGDAPSRSGSAR